MQINNIIMGPQSSDSQQSFYLKFCISVLKVFKFLHYFSILYTIIQNTLKFVWFSFYLKYFKILVLYWNANLCIFGTVAKYWKNYFTAIIR